LLPKYLSAVSIPKILSELIRLQVTLMLNIVDNINLYIHVKLHGQTFKTVKTVRFSDGLQPIR